MTPQHVILQTVAIKSIWYIHFDLVFSKYRFKRRKDELIKCASKWCVPNDRERTENHYYRMYRISRNTLYVYVRIRVCVRAHVCVCASHARHSRLFSRILVFQIFGPRSVPFVEFLRGQIVRHRRRAREGGTREAVRGGYAVRGGTLLRPTLYSLYRWHEAFRRIPRVPRALARCNLPHT